MPRRLKEFKQTVVSELKSKINAIKDANRAANEAANASFMGTADFLTDIDARGAILEGRAQEFFSGHPGISTYGKALIYERLANASMDRMMKKNVDWKQVFEFMDTSIACYLEAGMGNEAARVERQVSLLKAERKN